MTGHKLFCTGRKDKDRYFWLLFLLIVYLYSVFFNPAETIVYGVLTPHINIDPKETILYDYYVYGTPRRMREGYVTDVPDAISKLRERGEGIIIKVKGEPLQKRGYDYIYIQDESVPELNIEIYIAKNVEFSFGTFPFRTVKLFLENLIKNAMIYTFFCAFLICYGICLIYIRGYKAYIRL